MFAWSFAEALVWPIIPDALLIPMVMATPRRFPPLWLATVVGSGVGSGLLYLLAWKQPRLMHRLLVHLPDVREPQRVGAVRLLAAHGGNAFWMQPWSGIAFKVFGMYAAKRRLNPWRVLPIALAARAIRFAITGGAAALVGQQCQRLQREHVWWLRFGYAVVMSYGWWVTQVRRGKGA